MSRPRAAAMVLAGQLADTVAGLDAGTAAVMASQAAPRPAAVRQLGQHLAAYPDALATGSGDVPLPVARLAGLLAGAGYAGIRVPACLACGRTGELPHRAAGGRLCRNCYRQQRREPCQRCSRTRPVNTRTAAGPLCSPCAAALRPSRPCASCGQDRPGHGTARGQRRRVPDVLPDPPGTAASLRAVRPGHRRGCLEATRTPVLQLLRPAAPPLRGMRPGPPDPAARRRRPA